jgi:hypothetical protein
MSAGGPDASCSSTAATGSAATLATARRGKAGAAILPLAMHVFRRRFEPWFERPPLTAPEQKTRWAWKGSSVVMVFEASWRVDSAVQRCPARLQRFRG